MAPRKRSYYVTNYFRQQVALTHRNYRLFLVGQSMSLIGTWIQRIAMIWLAYRLTNSPFILGLIGFCEQIPIFVIAPFAGVYADRWDKHRALIRIESLAMIQAALLGVLTLTHMIQIWHIIALSLLLGIVNAFEVPMRQSFVVDMVDRDKDALGNAIALNSTIFNLSRLVGPSVAGILIGVAGEGWCFMANAFSYAIVVASLVMMKIQLQPVISTGQDRVLQKLKEGVQYLKGRRFMRSLLLLLAVVSFSNASLRTLAPIFAKNILHGGANTFGFLMSAAGVGAILGALFLTNHRSSSLLKRIVSVTGILLGVSMIFFGGSRWLWPSLFFMAVAGLAQMMHTASTNTLLQLHTDDDKRGRVMSFYTVCLQGMMPFGSLVAGSLADWIGGAWSMVAMGVICLVGALLHRGKPDSKNVHRSTAHVHTTK
jgi:MFS family permease